MSLWVKICANTTLEDALLAAEAGADAVGFVFASSPRRVTPEQVAAIIPHLPSSLEKIGVFVDASFDEIVTTIESTGLTGVQLHFEPPPELPARLRAHFGSELRILRVMHFGTEETTSAEDADHRSAKGTDHRSSKGTGFSPYMGESDSLGALAPEGPLADPHVDAILIDSRTATAVGGTGQRFDWSTASGTLFQNTKVRKHLIAAGGLTPENVAEAIAILHPWGVDVVSGVEASPGRKDAAKVRAFIANAQTAVGSK